MEEYGEGLTMQITRTSQYRTSVRSIFRAMTRYRQVT
jgi:hypothetical protein